MAEVTIRPTKNGPLIIEGPVELFDTEGNRIMVEKPRLALCRCGASSNKPFCDGTHERDWLSGSGGDQSRECGVIDGASQIRS